MGRTPVARDRLGDAVVEIIKVLLTESGESMSALQRASGMKLTRLHSILSAGAPIYVDELDQIAGCFGVAASALLEQAEASLRPSLSAVDGLAALAPGYDPEEELGAPDTP